MNNNYSEEIVNLLAQETYSYSRELQQQIYQETSRWLKKKKQLNTRLKNLYKVWKREQLLEGASKQILKDMSYAQVHKIFLKYRDAKRHLKDLSTMEDIANYYKEGYRLIHKIRERITGQDITYSILFEDKNAKIVEGHFNLEQILSMTSISYKPISDASIQTNFSNAVYLSLNTDRVATYVNNQINRHKENLEQLVTDLKKPDLWDSLVKRKDGSTNLGHLYEIYSVLTKVDKFKEINEINENQLELYKTLNKQAHNSTKGWKIGDLGEEQLKAIYNAAASLMDGRAMENTLTEINKAFSNYNIEKTKKAVLKIFTTQAPSFNNDIDKKAEEIAVKGIEDFFKNKD